MTQYEVIDKTGNVVHTGSQIVKTDEAGRAVVVYDELGDLPIGEYVLQPGGISLRIDQPGAKSVDVQIAP